MEGQQGFPVVRQVVFDTMDARRLAEFYRQLLGFAYRAGDEPPLDGRPDEKGRDWLVIRDPYGSSRLAFQHVDELASPTWPDPAVPQQLHLDLSVATTADLEAQHQRALNLGARLLLDRSSDEEEPLRVYADLEGHPFCIFVVPSDGAQMRPAAQDVAGEVAVRLAALGAATLGESGGVPMAPRLKPVWPGAQLAAPAYTVECAPADNLAIHVAVAQAPAGSALVVDASTVPERGFWGEVLTTGAQARGLAGLVIDGGVRDVSALHTHGFPVFSALVALRGATKNGPGTVGSPIVAGGVAVATGDWVVADADGVTVVPAGEVDAVLAAGQLRADRERGYFRALEEGRTTIDLLSLDTSRIAGA